MGGRTVWAQLTAWRRERAERALARLDLVRTTWSDDYVKAVASHDEWRRLRNAAKRARRAIRAAGGQA